MGGNSKCQASGHKWTPSRTKPGFETCQRCGARQPVPGPVSDSRTGAQASSPLDAILGETPVRKANTFSVRGFIRCLWQKHKWTNSKTHRGFMTCERCGWRRKFY